MPDVSLGAGRQTQPDDVETLNWGQGMTNTHQVVVDILGGLIRRRGDEPREITAESALTADLDLDSLELAELSAALEDKFGDDPYSKGIVPVTVGELTGFYE